MTKHRFTALCCGIALLGVTACGSSSKKTTTASSGLTQAQFIAQADAICAQGKAKRAALKAPNGDPTTANASNVKTFASYLLAASSSLQSDLTKVRALGTPTTGGAVLDEALAYGERSVAEQRAAGEAAASGNVPAFRAALVALETLRPPASIRSFGFKVCGTG